MSPRNRRSFLTASALTAAGLTGVSASTAAGDSRRRTTLDDAVTFVLVHTGYASAAWWDGVVRELALAGHRAVAVDLPGHGPHAYYPRAYQSQNAAKLRLEPSPAADLTVDDYAKAVAEVVDRAKAHGPVVLAAHGDAGAAAVTRVANAAPESVAHLVYLDAYLCVDSATIGEYLGLPQNDGALLAPVVKTPARLGIARVNWRTGDPKTLDAYYAALTEGMARDRFRAVLNSLSPDIGVSLWGDDLQVKKQTWGRIPRTYVRFTADRTIPLPLQDKMIDEADALTPQNPFRVRSVPLPHVGPLDHPDIVRTLGDIANELTRGRSPIEHLLPFPR